MNAFIDTNIFIYAHDESDKRKTQKARELIVETLKNNSASISTQIIQEFCNVMLKKSDKPLTPEDVDEIIDELLTPMLTHVPDAAFYKRAIKTYQQYSLNFYDALVVQAANDLDCKLLYSEDMQNGAHYGTVTIINPFL